MAKTPLSFTASVNPYAASSTGSDLHEDDFAVDFGGVSVGGGADNSWVSKLVRDLVVAGLSGLAIKYVWSKIK